MDGVDGKDSHLFDWRHSMTQLYDVRVGCVSVKNNLLIMYNLAQYPVNLNLATFNSRREASVFVGFSGNSK